MLHGEEVILSTTHFTTTTLVVLELMAVMSLFPLVELEVSFLDMRIISTIARRESAFLSQFICLKHSYLLYLLHIV